MPDRQTDRQTTEDRATQLLYSIQFKLSHAKIQNWDFTSLQIRIKTDPNNGHCHLTWDQADAKTADKLKEQKVRKWKFQGSYCES